MRGFCVTALREVPAIASYFVSFEFFCDTFSERREELSVSELLFAGGAAGCVSWLVTYPLDVIKTRFQADDTTGTLRQCARKAILESGMSVFWRGLVPTLIRCA